LKEEEWGHVLLQEGRRAWRILQAGTGSGAISLGSQGLIWHTAEQQKALLAAEALLCLATACGAANCLAKKPGRAHPEDIRRLKEEVQVEVVE